MNDTTNNLVVLTGDGLSRDLAAAVDAEMVEAAKRWRSLDEVNSVDDFIGYSLAYIGRATGAARNDADIRDGRISSKRAMLIKAIGLLARAAERA